MRDLEMTGDDICGYLREVAELLPTGDQRTPVMGEARCWHGMPYATAPAT